MFVFNARGILNTGTVHSSLFVPLHEKCAKHLQICGFELQMFVERQHGEIELNNNIAELTPISTIVLFRSGTASCVYPTVTCQNDHLPHTAPYVKRHKQRDTQVQT